MSFAHTYTCAYLDTYAFSKVRKKSQQTNEQARDPSSKGAACTHACMHACTSLRISMLVPLHLSVDSGCGGAQRSVPTGAWAKGTPRKLCTSPSLKPCMSPWRVATTSLKDTGGDAMEPKRLLLDLVSRLTPVLESGATQLSLHWPGPGKERMSTGVQSFFQLQ